MSFSSHPFKDFDVGYSENGYYHWICDGCGANSMPFASETSLKIVHRSFTNHVRKSHKMAEDNVKDWTSRVK